MDLRSGSLPLHKSIHSHSGLFFSHPKFWGAHPCSCLSFECLKKKLGGGSHFPSQMSIKQLDYYSTMNWGIASKHNSWFLPREKEALCLIFVLQFLKALFCHLGSICDCPRRKSGYMSCPWQGVRRESSHTLVIVVQ